MVDARECEGGIAELVLQIKVGELQVPMKVLVVGLRVVRVLGVRVVKMSDERSAYDR